MRRALLLAFAAASLAGPSSAGAADARCARFDPASFIKGVPYFSLRMDPSRSEGGSILLVHKDDRRISASVAVEPVATEVPTTKGAYISTLQAEVADEEANLRSPGVEVHSSLFPFDPIAWTVTARDASADGFVRGEEMVRLTNSCRLVVKWSGVNLPVLQSRVAELSTSVDAVRMFAADRAEPPKFLTDVYAPTGWRAIGLGFLLPLFVACAFAWEIRDTRRLPSPPAPTRAIAGVLCALCLVGLGTALPSFIAGGESRPFMDSLSSLTLNFLLLAAAAGSGKPIPSYLAFSCAVVFGGSIGIESWFGWTPGIASGYLPGVALFVGGLVSLALWHKQAFMAAAEQSVPAPIPVARSPKAKPKPGRA